MLTIFAASVKSPAQSSKPPEATRAAPRIASALCITPPTAGWRETDLPKTGYGISALSESEHEGVEVQSLSQFDTKTIAYLAPGHSCWNRQIALTCVKLCQVIWSPPVRTNSSDVTVLESSPTVFLAPPKLSLSDSGDAQQNPQFHSVVWGQRWGLLPCKRHPNGYRLP